jgi:lipopolysaccharide biosynthesis glycosyltransferase
VPAAREPIVVASGADSGYARALSVMLQSLGERLDAARTLELHVIDGGLRAGERARLEAGLDARTTLRWHSPDPTRFAGLPLWGRMSPATYDKLQVVDLLPREIERALWLDADLLVLDDLAKIWDRELEERSTCAVQDSVVPFLASRFGLAGAEARRHPPGTKYFNAGVLLFAPRRWREREVVPRALDYLRRFRDSVSFWDQEGLNAALAGDWLELEPRWNLNVDQATHGRRRDGAATLREEASVLHYCGRQKPWRYPGRNASFALYYEVLDRTGGAGWRPAPSWTWRALDGYSRSHLRPLLLPLERFWMSCEQRFTRRYLIANTTGGAAADKTEGTAPAREPAP